MYFCHEKQLHNEQLNAMIQINCVINLWQLAQRPKKHLASLLKALTGFPGQWVKGAAQWDYNPEEFALVSWWVWWLESSTSGHPKKSVLVVFSNTVTFLCDVLIVHLETELTWNIKVGWVLGNYLILLLLELGGVATQWKGHPSSGGRAAGYPSTHFCLPVAVGWGWVGRLIEKRDSGDALWLWFGCLMFSSYDEGGSGITMIQGWGNQLNSVPWS